MDQVIPADPSFKKKGVFSKIRKIPGLIRFQFRKSGKIRWLFIIGLVFNLGLWGMLIFLFRPQEAPIFLHYNIFFGIDLIGPWWKIFYLPVTGFVILVLNAILSGASFKEDKALSYTMMSLSILFQAMLMAGAYLIAQVN